MRTTQWPSRGCPQAPGPGPPALALCLRTHSPSRRAAQPPPAPRHDPAPRGCPACQAPPAAQVAPRDPAHPRHGPWGPGGRGHPGLLCHLWDLARQGSLRSPANHNAVLPEPALRQGLPALPEHPGAEPAARPLQPACAVGSGAAVLGTASSPALLTSRPGGPLSPGSPRLPFWPRSRSDTGRNESELPS